MSPGTAKPTGVVVGLIGQPCSGKSTLRRMLEELGARAIDADQIVRSLYSDADVRAEVVELFGADVLRPDGAVDRSRIAERVFSDRSLLEQLTQRIIWPRTGQRLQEAIEAFRRTARPGDLLILDAPTLLEAGRRHWVDRLVWVEAPWQRRLRWASARGWDEHELRRREQAMLPEASKKAAADFVIVNDGPIESLRQAARRLWQQLTDPA